MRQASRTVHTRVPLSPYISSVRSLFSRGFRKFRETQTRDRRLAVAVYKNSKQTRRTPNCGRVMCCTDIDKFGHEMDSVRIVKPNYRCSRVIDRESQKIEIYINR